MTAIDAIKARHCYRGEYEAIAVPREDLITIMEAGLAAPSGCNTQTTSLIAVDNEEVLEKLRQLMPVPVGKTAPAVICVLTQRLIAIADRCFAVQDYSAAIENMLIAAASLGYQSCWVEGDVTAPDKVGDKMAKLLGVPEGYELICYLPIGVAAKEVKGPKKKAFDERAWFNGFGGK